MEPTPLRSARGRGIVAAAILGSSIVFLDGTVVNVALPAIGRDLDAGLDGLQWVFTAYLLTLSALLLVAGSLGDLYGRRRLFLIGLTGFGSASVLCGLAPSIELLIAARALQGVAGAILTPGSLAIIASAFTGEERGRAIGTWAAATSGAIVVGPFVGGWLADNAGWQWVFLINPPIAAAAMWVTKRFVPETRDAEAARMPDYAGAITATIGLGLVTYGGIEAGARGFGPARTWGTLAAGAALLIVFVVLQMRLRSPMVPPSLFRSKQFTGANLVTLTVYAALNGALFALTIHLQSRLGYSATNAGLATVPLSVLLAVGSRWTGALAGRIGPRIPMTVGPALIAVSMVMLGWVAPGDSYAAAVLPGMLVFGVGLAFTVAPLTAAVLGAIEERRAGIGSGVNNAVARVAGLLAVALLPLVAGATGTAEQAALTVEQYATALRAMAGLSVVGAITAWATIRKA